MIKRAFVFFALPALLLFAQAGNGSASVEDDLDRLMILLRVDETIEIMQSEGKRYGSDLAQDMIPDADAESWESTLERIYDARKMLGVIKAEFKSELDQADLSPMIAYLESHEGAEIVQLEISARRAFLDREAEEAAIQHFEELEHRNAPIIAQIETLMTDSDLVEMNVMGTLNSSLMFYRGLNDGGAYAMSESEMLADVWAQEESTREEAQVWLSAFLTLAYQPLEVEQLEGYARFYRTPSGRQLNSAVFAAFDRMYEEISYLLGLAVAEHMTSEPL